MEIIGLYPIEKIIPQIRSRRRNCKKQASIELKDMYGNQHTIKLYNKKFQQLRRSRQCSECGKRGTIFKLIQLKNNKLVLELFHISSNEEVKMTVDHIKPISKNGTNAVVNLQTMCYHCNQKKGNSYG